MQRCPSCERLYPVNMDGQLRRHRCDKLQVRSVSVTSGGFVRVSCAFNLMRLTDRERRLVSALADAMQAFEAEDVEHSQAGDH